MGQPAAIIGDLAECLEDKHGGGCCHPHHVIGPAISGSPDVKVNNLPLVRMGDSGIHTACCGEGTWKVVDGSTGVFVNGRPVARKGDITQHCGGKGHLITGSANVVVGGGHYLFACGTGQPMEWGPKTILVLDEDGQGIGFINHSEGMTKYYDSDGNQVGFQEDSVEATDDLTNLIMLLAPAGKLKGLASKLLGMGGKKAVNEATLKLLVSQLPKSFARRILARRELSIQQKQAIRKVKGLEKQINEHKNKLKQYKRDPYAHDNKGHLKNASSAERKKHIYRRRINELEKQIKTFKKDQRAAKKELLNGNGD